FRRRPPIAPAQVRTCRTSPCGAAALFDGGRALDGDGVGVLVQGTLQRDLLSHEWLDLRIERGQVVELAVRLVEDLGVGSSLHALLDAAGGVVLVRPLARAVGVGDVARPFALDGLGEGGAADQSGGEGKDQELLHDSVVLPGFPANPRSFSYASTESDG